MAGCHSLAMCVNEQQFSLDTPSIAPVVPGIQRSVELKNYCKK